MNKHRFELLGVQQFHPFNERHEEGQPQITFADWDCRGDHSGRNLLKFLIDLPPEILPDDSFEDDRYDAGQYMVNRQRIWLNAQALQSVIKFLPEDGAYWEELARLENDDGARKFYGEIVAGFEAALKWLEMSEYHMVQLQMRFYG
jgi:hypothetical protein